MVIKINAKRFVKTVGVLLLCAAVIAAVSVGRAVRVADTVQLSAALYPHVTVDAGHGDFDGGAVASDGTQEKEINLAVSLPLSHMLRLCGFHVTMTRTDDTALCEDHSEPIRTKKVSDMKQRLTLFETADLNISVHQNSFGVKAYHGAQMFYSTNHPSSAVLAEAMRSEVVRLLQPDNTRELKTGNRDIYLLYKTTKPTVLVECGFLSNADELAQLKDAAYQRQVAFALMSGAVKYVCELSAEGGEAV